MNAERSSLKKGIFIGMTSQCLYGRVHPNVYTNLRRLSDIGCIFCEDILPETTFLKLAWLLGNYQNNDTIKKLLTKNLRGEINPRILKEQYLDVGEEK